MSDWGFAGGEACGGVCTVCVWVCAVLGLGCAKVWRGVLWVGCVYACAGSRTDPCG